ncbi:MAG: nucleotide sugar dehydrogenase, partial [Micromonosporaceae bacterium]
MTSMFQSEVLGETVAGPVFVAGGGPALADVAMEGTEPAGAVIGIVGLGYVGLPTALALAEAGSSVIGCEVSDERLADIRSGAVDLLETDHARLRRQMGGDRLRLTVDPAALRGADTVVICVPTPVDEHLTPDLSAVAGACRTVVQHAVPGQLIVLTSTTYVGCTRDHLVKPLAERGLRVGVDVFVAFSPERIDPGVAKHAQESTPRVVGGATPACRERAVQALRRVAPYVHEVSSPEAAEMTKLLENSFRAVNIAFANEVSELARELGLDPVEVIEAAATKPYGFMAFYPGPGVGG